MQKKWQLRTIFFSVFCLIICSCTKEVDPAEQFKKDEKAIQSYIQKNNLDAHKTASGLFYVIHEEGIGDYPESTDNVTVQYRGYTLDDKVFDQSGPEGIAFNLQNVIKGWTEGIPKFRVGGSGMLLIPSKLAYGTKGSGPIPPNTPLVFDIKLLSIN